MLSCVSLVAFEEKPQKTKMECKVKAKQLFAHELCTPDYHVHTHMYVCVWKENEINAKYFCKKYCNT